MVVAPAVAEGVGHQRIGAGVKFGEVVEVVAVVVALRVTVYDAAEESELEEVRHPIAIGVQSILDAQPGDLQSGAVAARNGSEVDSITDGVL